MLKLRAKITPPLLFSIVFYIVAKAKVLGGSVVTAEKLKPASAQLPNLCKELNVPFISYDDFMEILDNLIENQWVELSWLKFSWYDNGQIRIERE